MIHINQYFVSNFKHSLKCAVSKARIEVWNMITFQYIYLNKINFALFPLQRILKSNQLVFFSKILLSKSKHLNEPWKNTYVNETNETCI